jgi:hypothetical protein
MLFKSSLLMRLVAVVCLLCRTSVRSTTTTERRLSSRADLLLAAVLEEVSRAVEEEGSMVEEREGEGAWRTSSSEFLLFLRDCQAWDRPREKVRC